MKLKRSNGYCCGSTADNYCLVVEPWNIYSDVHHDKINIGKHAISLQRMVDERRYQSYFPDKSWSGYGYYQLHFPNKSDMGNEYY